MRPKNTSGTLKRHRQTFHLARHDPERWEQERDLTTYESLCEARERASIMEEEAKVNKQLLKYSQQEVGPFVICRDELPTTKLKGRPSARETGCLRNGTERPAPNQQDDI